MLRSPARSRDVSDDPSLGRNRRRLRFRPALPSPFLVVVAVVFVVLPLVWTEPDPAEAPAASPRAAYNLLGDVAAVAVSPTGELVAATGREQPISLWSRPGARDAAEYALAEHRPGGTRCLAFSPDGAMLAGGNVDGTVTLWDLGSKEPLGRLDSGDEMILAIAFSPDGAVLATASSDSRVRVWDMADRRRATVLRGHGGPVTSLAYSPDGRTLYSGGEDQTIRAWDLEGRRRGLVLAEDAGVVLAVACSPAGDLLASSSLCDHQIRLWDPRTGEARGAIPADAPTHSCLAFAPDGKSLLTGDEHGYVGLCDLATFKERRMFLAHRGWLKSMALVGGGTLASGGNDGMLRVWDLAKMVGAAHRPT